ncbi:uncharacterized protein LOC133859947 [Alnus glutinosa]|uniref:uncharacterized protein LOC133859947 n=1 Tax=Alnus glutinosa TaxID=3517 RepID=UPI002D79CAC9|nr:uncharacterized protein LOC133859947 [Alnus glutinosa]
MVNTRFKTPNMKTILIIGILLASILFSPSSINARELADQSGDHRKSLSLDVSTKIVPGVVEGSSEGLNISSNKIVSFRSLREGGTSGPPSPRLNVEPSPGGGH